MFRDHRIALLFHNRPIEARIVTLTADLARDKLMGKWWNEKCLKRRFASSPIDRHWDWNALQIEYEDRILASTKVAVVTGEGEDVAVQGAMMIATEPVPSVLDPSNDCLVVELLFTAPRNRPELRRDGKPHFIGVGSQLLTWAAWLSRTRACDGRLYLDASPDFVAWYGKRGLQSAGLNPIVREGVAYLPMELSAQAATELLSCWDV